MNPSTLVLAETASWVGVLIPLLAAPLLLLLLWEVVVLVGAVIGWLSVPPAGSRTGSGGPEPQV